MPWEVVGILADVISAVAVVVTLIFLVVEIRSSRDATRSAAVDAASTGFATMNTALIGEPDCFEAFLDAQTDPDKLSRLDRARVQLVMQTYVNHYTTLKKYHDAGALPDDVWRGYAVAMAALTNSPGGEQICAQIEISDSVREELKTFRGKETPYGFSTGA